MRHRDYRSLIIYSLISATCSALDHPVHVEDCRLLERGEHHDILSGIQHPSISANLLDHPTDRSRSPSDSNDPKISSADSVHFPQERSPPHVSFASSWPESPGSIDQFSAWKMEIDEHLPPNYSPHPLYQPSEESRLPPSSKTKTDEMFTFAQLPPVKKEPYISNRVEYLLSNTEGPQVSSQELTQISSPGVTQISSQEVTQISSKEDDQISGKEENEFSSKEVPQITSKPSTRDVKFRPVSKKFKPPHDFDAGRVRTPAAIEKSNQLELKFERNKERRKLIDLEDLATILKRGVRLLKKSDSHAEIDRLPRLSFDRYAFCDEKRNEKLEEHPLFPILDSMKISEGGRMELQEWEFRNFIGYKYNPLRYKELRQDVEDKWTDKLHLFMENQKVWETYWDRINLEACNDQIESKKFQKLLPLFLFYVEMINAVIPRPEGQEVNEDVELIMACTVFIKYAQQITKYVKDHAGIRITSFKSRSSLFGYF
ncbi:hypothetical protein PGT21_035434 [Puccinia graminis f. sp. tritici]|uniref:Uncharacterized protein n=1 Tax=Puccinia graminis f. sp. tritici TaxID=56615 RepID=A0A5B0Q8P3_PUCGR|nr:hypothetical protein PGTUg99_021083 [Puccinia graminis f. sp. tritici]KAA1119853.1 hypothetical protein PGT21_035434 [Puccinia graminis f. sp. tritici]